MFIFRWNLFLGWLRDQEVHDERSYAATNRQERQIHHQRWNDGSRPDDLGVSCQSHFEVIELTSSKSLDNKSQKLLVSKFLEASK